MHMQVMRALIILAIIHRIVVVMMAMVLIMMVVMAMMNMVFVTVFVSVQEDARECPDWRCKGHAEGRCEGKHQRQRPNEGDGAPACSLQSR